MGRKGKLTPDQLKQRRRNTFLNEITPEWRAYQVEQYRIQDVFEDTVRQLGEENYVEKYVQAFDTCRVDCIAVPTPEGPMWLEGKEPHVQDW